MSEQWIPDEVWERAIGTTGIEILPDDTVQLRDGEWRLTDPWPTIGDRWRVFDGWWKPS